MNPNLIIKELQNNFPHLFGGSEQSEDAYATIVRYCREQGGYKQKLVAKEAAQKTIEKTKKPLNYLKIATLNFQMIGKRYARPLPRQKSLCL